MSTWPEWAGDIPTWITTLAIGLAAGQFLTDRKRRRAEEARESKAQATRLSAWTVTDPKASPRVFGVVVSNSSHSTFHDVVVKAKMKGEMTKRPIRLATLPPGRYFVRLHPAGYQYTWDFPIEADSYDSWLQPYMNTSDYQVCEITFSDNLNQDWSTNEHAVLERA